MNNPDKRVFSVEIDAPIETVWAEITRLDRSQRAYFNHALQCELRAGSSLRYVGTDGEASIVGEVVEVSPPHRFVHTFSFTNLADETSRVTWELESLAGGTRVTIIHSELDRAPQTGEKIVHGWPTIVAQLKTLLEKGDLPAPMTA